MKTLKRFFSTALVFFLIAVQLFAATPKQIAMAGDFSFRYGKPQLWGSRTSDLLNAAGEGQGGVLFRAIAVPGDKALLNQPISLKYHSVDNDGSRLRISFGNRTIVENELYDWMLLPVAAFADTPYYNCVTLLAKPVEREEVYRSIFASQSKRKVYFAEYHPALVNTLIGLNLLLVDAIFMNPDVRKIPYLDEMGILNGYNANANQIFNLDLSKSDYSLMEVDSKRFEVDKKQPNDGEQHQRTLKYASYIFSDPDEGIPFTIENGGIKFGNTAIPYYHFLDRKDGAPQGSRQYIHDKELTDDIRNSKLVRNISPAIFDTAEKTAQWAAFFRYVKINAPDAWYDFIMQIKDKITESKYITGKGPEDGRYQYQFDSDDYHWETPRMFGFFGEEKNFEGFVPKQDALRSEFVKKYFTQEQQRIYSSLTQQEMIIYISLQSDDKNQYMMEKCDLLSPRSRSVFLNLYPARTEMDTYLSLTPLQREVCDGLDGGTRRRDFLFLTQKERDTYMSFTPEQREIWYGYDEAKRNKFLSLTTAERHRFMLDDKTETSRLRTANQYEKLVSLTQKQQEIYFSIAIPHERDAYLSLTLEQREFCDSLSITDRYEFLSISPRERDRFILEKTVKTTRILDLSMSGTMTARIVLPQVYDELAIEPPVSKKISPRVTRLWLMNEKDVYLTLDQWDIYSSLTFKEKAVYLALTPKERNYCDRLYQPSRTTFLSATPIERMEMMSERNTFVPKTTRSYLWSTPDITKRLLQTEIPGVTREKTLPLKKTGTTVTLNLEQWNIYSSLTSEEKVKYLSLTQKERDFLGGLDKIQRARFLSGTPILRGIMMQADSNTLWLDTDLSEILQNRKLYRHVKPSGNLE